MEGRMTLCNMSIESGARAGMVAPDEVTFAYLQGRRFAPRGDAWDEAVAYWSRLHTDEDAGFDRLVEFDAASLAPHVTWGTSPGQVVPVTGRVPDPAAASDEADRRAAERALDYMGLRPLTPVEEIAIDRVFIGSAPRSLEACARGPSCAAHIARSSEMVVPGSRPQARREEEGLPNLPRGRSSGASRLRDVPRKDPDTPGPARAAPRPRPQLGAAGPAAARTSSAEMARRRGRRHLRHTYVQYK